MLMLGTPSQTVRIEMQNKKSMPLPTKQPNSSTPSRYDQTENLELDIDACCTTTDTFADAEIEKYLGTVAGTEIYLVGGILGGGLANQEKLFGNAFNKAKERMVQKAFDRRGNAVVGMQVANYEIWRLSGHDIELVKRTGESSASTIIEEEVYAVAWDDNYIFVQHEPMEPDKEDYTKEPHGELDYYIFVVSSEEVLGPFTRSEFEETCVSRNYPLPQEWIQVRTLPRQ